MYYYIKGNQVLLGSETKLAIEHDKVIECATDQAVIIKDGQPTVVNITDVVLPDDLVKEAYQGLLDAQLKSKIRQDITENAGDSLSLLGTTADGAQIALYVLAILASSDSFASFKTAMEAFKPIAQSFLAKIESGEVELPFMTKGIDSVVTDIEQRATAVSQAIKQNQPTQE